MAKSKITLNFAAEETQKNKNIVMEATTQYNDIMVRVPIGNATNTLTEYTNSRGWMTVVLPNKESNTTRQDMLFRLEELKAQPENWDGYGAVPLEAASYQNMLSAINNTPQDALTHWNLFPDTNGTLLLTTDSEKLASISIGNEYFSYVAIVDENHKIQGQEPFSPAAFAIAISRINKLLSNDQ